MRRWVLFVLVLATLRARQAYKAHKHAHKHTHTRRMHTYERQSSPVALTVACLERGQHVYMKYIEKKIEKNFSLIAYKLMHKN